VGSADPVAWRLVEVGNPMRNIASCAAFHGPLGFTPGAPERRGQQRAYLEEQLQAFKAGRRHNDISEQMRSVARADRRGDRAACGVLLQPGEEFRALV
jgi:cytochrome c553